MCLTVTGYAHTHTNTHTNSHTHQRELRTISSLKEPKKLQGTREKQKKRKMNKYIIKL